MTETLLQSGFQLEHHEMHAFEFEYIGQGAPHDLPTLAKQGVGSTLAGVGSQQSVEAEFLGVSPILTITQRLSRHG